MRITDVIVRASKPKFIPNWLYKYTMKNGFSWEIQFIEDDGTKANLRGKQK